MLRRTKASEVKELPPKIEQTRECALTPAQITQIANLGFPHELVADPKSRDLVRS